MSCVSTTPTPSASCRRRATVQRWSAPYAPPGVSTAAFAEQKIIRWQSFDGRQISGLLSMPPARFTGKRPVLVDIHGGPEAQAELGFLGRNNYLIEELGIAVILDSKGV